MKKILAVCTNSDALLKGRRTGLWLSELTHFLAEIVAAGFGYDIASPRGGKIALDEGTVTPRQLADPANAQFMADPSFAARLERSLACGDVDPQAYAAVYLAGGHGTMFDFRGSPELQDVLRAVHGAGGYVTGVCHGVSGLVDVTDERGRYLVAGKRVTGFSNNEDRLVGVVKLLPFLLEDALEQRGADYRKNLVPFTGRVEVDGRLITGQNPRSARGVGAALVERLR